MERPSVTGASHWYKGVSEASGHTPYPLAANMKVGAFRLVLLLLLQLLHESAALYYKPRPLVCPVTQEVEYVNETLSVTQLDIVLAPFQVNKVTVNTVYQNLPLDVTRVALHTVTAVDPQVEVTQVQLVHETVPVSIVKISTVTRTITQTLLSPLTRTATNYLTQVETLAVPETVHETVTVAETTAETVTQRRMAMETSTLRHTKVVLKTKLVVEVVREKSLAATSTVLEVDTVTNTHILTKMITQTICPPPVY